MRGEDHRRAIRHLVELLDEHRAEPAQAFDDVHVVHHLVPDVDRRSEHRERALDDVDGAVDAGAETTWIGEQYLHDLALSCAARFSRRASSNASRITRPAPMEMAASATLNAGNAELPQCVN